MCPAITLKNRPASPSGSQLQSTIRPPGLSTRATSAAALRWSGANMTPKTEITASKLSSS